MSEPFADAKEVTRLQTEMSEMRSAVTKVAEAVAKLAVLEERQQTTAETTTRILDAVEKIKEKQHAAEVEAAAQGDLRARHEELANKVRVLEEATKSSHIEDQKEKARRDAALMMVRALWAVTIPLIGAVVWAIKHLP